MNEEELKNVHAFSDEMIDYLRDLIGKSLTVFEKSKGSSNITMNLCSISLPIRVDDLELMYIGAYLLPNIMNYLVNILPQFIYPYVVAYLQDLSSMRDDPITIHELFDFLINYNHGNIHECTQAES